MEWSKADKAKWGVTERVAVVTVALIEGQGMTVAEVAELAGITRGGAYAMLCKLSAHLPIYHEPATGRWHYLPRRASDA